MLSDEWHVPSVTSRAPAKCRNGAALGQEHGRAACSASHGALCSCAACVVWGNDLRVLSRPVPSAASSALRHPPPKGRRVPESEAMTRTK